MNSNCSETIFVGDTEMAKWMRNFFGDASRSRFVCVESDTDCSQTLSQTLLRWVETCHKTYKRQQSIRLTLPAWFDRQFSGATGAT